MFEGFIRKCEDSVGRIMASRDIAYEKANAEARAQAQAAAYQQAAANLHDTYLIIGDLLAQTINNSYSTSHLLPIQHASQILTEPWLIQLSDGSYALRYHARKATGFDLSANDVRHITQMELNRLTALYNLPRLEIQVKFQVYSNVEIVAAPASGVVI